MNVAHLYGKLAHQPAFENPAVYHGGAQKIACQIALSMREYADQVFFFSDDNETTAVVQMFQREGILHRQVKFRIQSFKWLAMIVRVMKIVRHEQIDVLHCHSRFTLFCAWTVSKLAGIKLIYTAHSVYEDKWLTRYFFGQHIVAISLQVKNNLTGYFSVKEDRISLIYNGVDIKNAPIDSIHKIDELYGLTGKNPVVVAVGRLHSDKGLEYLLRSLPRVVKEYPLLRLLLVGEGDLRSYLEDLVDELGVNSYVIFCGRQHDPRPFMQRSVCLCMPSLREGFGCVMVEAMLLEVPVIVTRVGVAPEIIGGGTGIFVPQRDSQKLADALLRVLRNPNDSKEMGERGKLLVESKLSLLKMQESYRRYYDELF